jgi:hypothetical protein
VEKQSRFGLKYLLEDEGAKSSAAQTARQSIDSAYDAVAIEIIDALGHEDDRSATLTELAEATGLRANLLRSVSDRLARGGIVRREVDGDVVRLTLLD